MTSLRPLALLAVLPIALLPARVEAGRFIMEITEEDTFFDDATAVAAVAGNPGRTLGEQRRNVFEAAGEEWMNRLVSSPDIRVEVGFEALECEATTGVLAFAGPTFVFLDPGLVRPNTWYSWAQTNAFFGTEVNPDEEAAHISMRINSDLGKAGCLASLMWDHRIGVPATGAGVSLFNVILHELAHGLGFLSLVDLEDGSRLMGSNDAFMHHLEDHSLGKSWTTMSNAQRLVSLADDGDLHWVGPNTLLDAATLVSGAGEGGHPVVFTREGDEPGGEVSHFDPAIHANLDELLEPFETLRADGFLSVRAFQDMGWSVNYPAIVGLEDLDGLGADEIAVLRMGPDSADHGIYVLDPLTQSVVSEFSVPDTGSALGVGVVQSFGGTSASEVAVLTWAPRGNLVRVYFNDASSGARVRELGFPSSFPREMQTVASFGSTSADELAVLATLAGGTNKLFIKDVRSGVLLTNLTLPSGLLAGFTMVPSFGGTSAPEIAVVTIDTATDKSILSVFDAGSRAKLFAWVLPADFLPSHVTRVHDFGGSGADEVAILGTRLANDNPQVQVVDPSSGVILMTRTFPDRFHPRGMRAVPDYGDTPAEELAIVGRRRANVRTRLFVIDASSGASLTTTTVPHKEQPHAFAVVPDSGGSNAPDVMIVTTAAADGEVRVYAKDARGATIRSFIVGGS